MTIRRPTEATSQQNLMGTGAISRYLYERQRLLIREVNYIRAILGLRPMVVDAAAAPDDGGQRDEGERA